MRVSFREKITSFISGFSLFSLTFTHGYQIPPTMAQTTPYCVLSPQMVQEKDRLRTLAVKGSAQDQQNYQQILQSHRQLQEQCRSKSWLKTQAIWLRVYPCDTQPGMLDEVLDRIVNKGYNTVYLEVFYDSQVLLPQRENDSPWVSVVRTPGLENRDLLAEVIDKGHQRGLKVYSWMFTMNFGYSYAQLADRRETIAKNGKGQYTPDVVDDQSQAFIDPYNRQAQTDYYRMIQKVVQRKPDGVLFDYVRYPRGSGSSSVIGNVKELWLYGPASYQTLLDRALNQKGRLLLERFVNQGYITTKDIQDMDRLYPNEGSPLWQNRNPYPTEMQWTIDQRRAYLQQELWYFTVAHTAQGILDFVSIVSRPARDLGIPTGAVFFPEGNQGIGEQGFDSRLQPWNNFSPEMEWHPMSYAVCEDARCIVDQVRRVRSMANPITPIIPALAGVWGKSMSPTRPALEIQMDQLHQAIPQVNAISHFAFSWQEPEFDRQRKFCQVQS